MSPNRNWPGKGHKGRKGNVRHTNPAGGAAQAQGSQTGDGIASLEGDLARLRREFNLQSPRAWAQRHVRTESGQPLDFSDRPWLAEIYDDPHLRKVVQKAAQVGLTMYGVVVALHRAALHGETVMFTMPTGGDVRDLVLGRINPVIDNSPVLRALATSGSKHAGGHGPVDNTGLKSFGLGRTYFRGTQAERAAASVPAQVLINDEVDFSDQRVLAQYEHRLDAVPPEQRRIYQMSTPSVAGYGISAAYEASDASEWMVLCDRCGWRGPLDYWEHTQGESPYLRCNKCGGTLDPRRGLWVPRHPDRSVRGYHVSRLMLALPERPDILQALHERRRSAPYPYHFYMLDLGVPSEEGTQRISREAILGACFLENYYTEIAAVLGAGPYYMGVDQGDTLTVVVVRADPPRDGGKFRVVYRERLRDPQRGSGAWAQVGKLMHCFQVRLCVVDGNPNSASAHDLAREFPGRVAVCYYVESPRVEVAVASDVDKRAAEGPAWPTHPVTATERDDMRVDRTATLDRTAQALQEGGFMLPAPHTLPETEELIRQCTNNVRRPEEAGDGTIRHRWVSTGPNDYFHALNYARIAAEEGTRRAQINPSVSMPPIIHGVPLSGTGGRGGQSGGRVTGWGGR